ncbi:MAG: FkbM family methyltransferase [Nitrospina sp.]|nr:MAG: FkbM family methyltransferase [Nitrospina sp.]
MLIWRRFKGDSPKGVRLSISGPMPDSFPGSPPPGSTSRAFSVMKPSRSISSSWKKNRQLNAKHDIHPHQSAVAGKAGDLTFDLGDSFTTSQSMTHKQEGEETRVNRVTLEDIFETYGLERYDFLKMDCEGAEYDIFYNCPDGILARIDQIAMEVHHGAEPGRNTDALERFFNDKGFKTLRRPVNMLWAWKNHG